MTRRTKEICTTVLTVLVLMFAGYVLLTPSAAPVGNGTLPARPAEPAPVVRPRVAIVGDTWAAGSAVGGRGERNWSMRMADERGWDVRRYLARGSGYSVGGKTSIRTRLTEVAASRPDVVLLWAADVERDWVRAGNGATATYRELERLVPSARIIVIGSVALPGRDRANDIRVSTAQRFAAWRTRIPYIDPLDDRWFDGPKARYLGRDRVHLTDDGHRYVADLIDAELTKLRV